MQSGLGGFRVVTGATEHRKPRIFREACIGFRKPAKKETRALCGFDQPGVLTIAAQAEGLQMCVTDFGVGHRDNRFLLAQQSGATATAMGSASQHRRAWADSVSQNAIRRCAHSLQYSSP